ncbi:hypothetical protein IWX75_003205 [Arthrobacter sp. CAN_A6]|uniref:DUF6270 domain-containing protein n=1 Tax=Arthrobacter sp. CAN_A6 TaxID=2787721 RepID=UPI0018CB90F2
MSKSSEISTELEYPFEQCDHEVWKVPTHSWKDLDAFLSSTSWQNGLHSISFDHAPHLDLLVHGLDQATSKNSALPVFFNGAVTAREEKVPPFFSGLKIARQGGYPYVALSDASLQLNDSLGLGWYIGNTYTHLQSIITGILFRLAEMTGRELLLVGGSGGGFASLFYGERLGDLASVFVWNPQTNFLDYNELFVKRYLRDALEDPLLPDLDAPDWKIRVADTLLRHGFEAAVPSTSAPGIHSRPRRSLYLQNSSDWHVISHLLPFIGRSDYAPLGEGVYSGSDEHIAWIAQFGEGHAAPSPEVISDVVERLIDTRISVSEIVERMQRDLVFGPQRVELVPRDLTSLAGRIEELVRLDVRGSGGSVDLELDLDIIPLGYGGLTIEFAEVTNGTIEVIRRFEGSNTHRHVGTAGQESVYRAALKDGFGNLLLEVISQPTTQKNGRLFICGSSASMEAFATSQSVEIVHYSARSSLGSSFQAHVLAVSSSVHTDKLESTFQRRLVETDIFKKLSDDLNNIDFDLLLLDLLDERIPLASINGTYITHSPELKRTGFHPPIGSEIEPGSDHHLQLCEAGISRLLEIVGPHRVLVNNVYWATHNVSGELLQGQEEISRNNRMLARLYDMLLTHKGVRFVNYPDGTILSAQNHKWGDSPYRFGPGVDQYLRKSVSGALFE